MSFEYDDGAQQPVGSVAVTTSNGTLPTSPLQTVQAQSPQSAVATTASPSAPPGMPFRDGNFFNGNFAPPPMQWFQQGWSPWNNRFNNPAQQQPDMRNAMLGTDMATPAAQVTTTPNMAYNSQQQPASQMPPVVPQQTSPLVRLRQQMMELRAQQNSMPQDMFRQRMFYLHDQPRYME